MFSLLIVSLATFQLLLEKHDATKWKGCREFDKHCLAHKQDFDHQTDGMAFSNKPVIKELIK